MGSEAYFIDYDGGKWTDVSSKIVDGWSKNNYYVFPRTGTTVQVFAKLPDESESDSDTAKGKKLYDLAWKDGRFTRK